MARRAREAKVLLQKASTVYLDEFSKYLYELKAIQASEETGESISYLAGATLKSFDNYVRYVVDETREVLKEKQLKASRTKISLLWNLDKYEMRGERLQVAESIQQRLRDYVTDVEIASRPKGRGGAELLDPLKHNVVIVCSKDDLDVMKMARKEQRSVETTVLSATPGLDRE
jgi:tagatose-1,6-bisphosphate aldolase